MRSGRGWPAWLRSLLMLPLFVLTAVEARAQLPTAATDWRAIDGADEPIPSAPTSARRDQIVFTSAVPRMLVRQQFRFAVTAISARRWIRLTDVEWSSSSPDVASISADGLVEARAEGRTFITATSGTRSARVRVTVLHPPGMPRPVTSLEVNPGTIALTAGDSLQLAASPRSSNGAVIPDAAVTFTSSDTTVARVTAGGLLIARSAGAGSVTATSGTVSTTVALSIQHARVTNIEVTSGRSDVEEGTALQLIASARSAGGAVVPDARVQFSSSDTTIAVISASGLLHGRSVGSVEVIATSGSATGKVKVQVQRSRVVVITVNPAAVAATTADTVPLTVSGTRRDGTAVALTDLRAAAQRGTIRNWTYVPPTTAGADTITVTSTDGFATRVPATITPVVAAVTPTPVTPTPVTPPVDTAPTPVPPPTNGGALPLYTAPTLPAATVNVSVPAVTGRTIRVPAGDSPALQAALSEAVGGDEIVLPNGSTFRGNFVLPRHTGSAPVTLRSETVGVAPGVRVTPGTASGFAQIVTPNSAAALETSPGASGWRLIGLQVLQADMSALNYGIIKLGTGSETSEAQLVRDIVLDRVYVSAGPTNHTRRCVGFNGNSLAVVDSWLADCHSKGFDTQGIGGWTGAGPFLIQNNHIEGAGQGVMFGGADPQIPGMIPSDITIRGNHFFKPKSWGGGRWTVKATFELKNARRVLFEGNVLENHWVDAQVGFAILMMATNQDGGAPWSTVQDITIQNNIVKASTGGVNISSRWSLNGGSVIEQAQRVLVRNNLFADVGRDPVTGVAGRLLQLIGDMKNVTIVQNTFVGGGYVSSAALVMDGDRQLGTMILNNVFGATEVGLFGSGAGEGSRGFATYLTGGIVQGNALVGRPASLYPVGTNAFPSSLSFADFNGPSVGDFTLRASLPWSASGGSLVGVDGRAVLAATRSVVTP